MTTPDSTLIERLKEESTICKRDGRFNPGFLDLAKLFDEAIDELTRLEGCLERLGDDKRICVERPTNPLLQYEYEMQARIEYARASRTGGKG